MVGTIRNVQSKHFFPVRKRLLAIPLTSHEMAGLKGHAGMAWWGL
jgi:hypothetical protein